MPHQLPQCHWPLLLGEFGHVCLDLLVQLQPVLLQQQTNGSRSQHDGGGADPEPGIGRDGYPILEVRPAKAFGPHDVAIDTDCH